MIFWIINNKKQITTLSVCQSTQCWDLELASTQQQRTQGMMYRKTRNTSQGMLFVFPQEGYYDFRMKNTILPLDIIRLDGQKRIVDIQEALPCKQEPCLIYHPSRLGQYVIEFPQGTAKNNHWTPGTQFLFSETIS